MPTCPACHKEQKKRVDGRCPECGTRVEMHGGYWYRQDIGSPTLAVITYFEKLAAKKLSAGRTVPVPFSIPRKGLRWKRESVVAERLLKQAEGDFDLVKEALDIIFTDKKFNWRTLDTLLYIEQPFTTTLAIARSNRELEALRRAKENQALTALEVLEDIFS